MIQSTADLTLGEILFCLFKSEPGKGKSIAAGSFPNPIFFDLDQRIRAILLYWTIKRGKKIDYMQPKSFYELFHQLEEFQISCPYQTIVIDGITSLADLILATMVDTRPADSRKVIRGGMEMYQIEDYGGESRGLSLILDKLKSISLAKKVNVVVTAHVLETKDVDLKSKETTVSRTLLTAGKKIAAKLPMYFDEAYQFDTITAGITQLDPKTNKPLGTEEVRYTCITQPSGDDWAKTALPLPYRMDFTNGSLYEIIMSYIKRDKAPNGLISM